MLKILVGVAELQSYWYDSVQIQSTSQMKPQRFSSLHFEVQALVAKWQLDAKMSEGLNFQQQKSDSGYIYSLAFFFLSEKIYFGYQAEVVHAAFPVCCWSDTKSVELGLH